MEAKPPYPPVPLRPRDEFFRALTEDGAYAPEAPFPFPVEVPTMGWKADPRQGYLLAQIVDATGRPADGALVRIEKVGTGPLDQSIVLHTDGNGYAGEVDLAPGAYQLRVEVPGSAERVTVPEPVVPGRVTRIVVDLSLPVRGPKVRTPHVFGAHERTDRFDDASPLEEWFGREPIPEDLQVEPPAVDPNLVEARKGASRTARHRRPFEAHRTFCYSVGRSGPRTPSLSTVAVQLPLGPHR